MYCMQMIRSKMQGHKKLGMQKGSASSAQWRAASPIGACDRRTTSLAYSSMPQLLPLQVMPNL